MTSLRHRCNLLWSDKRARHSPPTQAHFVDTAPACLAKLARKTGPPSPPSSSTASFQRPDFLKGNPLGTRGLCQSPLPPEINSRGHCSDGLHKASAQGHGADQLVSQGATWEPRPARPARLSRKSLARPVFSELHAAGHPAPLPWARGLCGTPGLCWPRLLPFRDQTLLSVTQHSC